MYPGRAHPAYRGLEERRERGITPPVETSNQQPPVVQRVRVTFSKSGATRYISHLDLARALERALNRAGLPIAYTQGFNRRPRLSLAAALPLGYTSEAEMADVWLTDVVLLEAFITRLQQSLPPGIDVRTARDVGLSEPSIQQQTAGSIYEVEFLEPVDEGTLRAGVAAILDSQTLLRERARPKQNRPQVVDLRPLIIDMIVHPGDDGHPRLQLHLVQSATQTGRPDDVLAALGFDPLDTRVHRRALLAAE